MSKRNIGYVIELDSKRGYTYLANNCLRYACVFSTRKRARQNKRRFGGLYTEIIYQVLLDCSGRPVAIIKKVR